MLAFVRVMNTPAVNHATLLGLISVNLEPILNDKASSTAGS